MEIAAADLPDDVEVRRAMLAAERARAAEATAQIEQS
jgi:hypothetical protein